MTSKSERLRKLEVELEDLQRWLKLGLVPRKDMSRHLEEISLLQSKIEEERDRLQNLRETGQLEEYITPKRQVQRSPYSDTPTMPDIDMMEDGGEMSDTSFDSSSETTDLDTSYATDERDLETNRTAHEEPEPGNDDADPERDRNRWKRGFRDPDDDEW